MLGVNKLSTATPYSLSLNYVPQTHYRRMTNGTI